MTADTSNELIAALARIESLSMENFHLRRELKQYQKMGILQRLWAWWYL